MKLLFDQNLSHTLPAWLGDIFPNSDHILRLGLDRASDDTIWEYAQKNGFAIVTQDVDFSERSLLLGSPPKVVWVRCGNSTPRKIEAMIRRAAPKILALERDPRTHFIEIAS